MLLLKKPDEFQSLYSVKIVDLCVKPSPGASHRPFPGTSAAMSMLVNLAVGAVKVMHLRALRADQQLFLKPG